MCGIFGVFCGDPSDLNKPIANEKIHALASLLSHRGPDSTSIVKCNSNTMLGHVRLAINDIDGGIQPFFDKASNSFWVVNGEVYNYHSIAQYLTRYGVSLKSKSDCEVVGHTILDGINGFDKLPLLQGMYAGAFTREGEQGQCELILFRDHFGEKPLYYLNYDNHIYFSSEIKPLMQVNSLACSSISNSSIADFLIYGYPLGNEPLGNNIFSVPAGHMVKFTTKSDEIQSHIQPLIGLSSYQNLDHQDNIEHLLETYIKKCSLSDVPIAIGLSAGRDSSLIASTLRDKLDCAYTVGYESAGGSDEIDDAKAIATELGIPHKSVLI